MTPKDRAPHDSVADAASAQSNSREVAAVANAALSTKASTSRVPTPTPPAVHASADGLPRVAMRAMPPVTAGSHRRAAIARPLRAPVHRIGPSATVASLESTRPAATKLTAKSKMAAPMLTPISQRRDLLVLATRARRSKVLLAHGLSGLSARAFSMFSPYASTN